MADVTIPADEARQMADTFREQVARGVVVMDQEREAFQRWADLLDPTPPTLREKVAEAIDAATLARAPHGYVLATVERDAIADAVLAAISSEMAKRPLLPADGYDRVGARRQRDADVAWLRGES